MQNKIQRAKSAITFTQIHNHNLNSNQIHKQKYNP
jgi:hypothetical protein